MTPRTLRGRLTAAAALAVVLAVAVLAVCAQLLVGPSAARVARQQPAPPGRRRRPPQRVGAALLTAPGALESPVAGAPALGRGPATATGASWRRSLTLGAKLLPDSGVASDALRHGRDGFADVRLSGEPLRLYAAPLPEDGGPAAGRRRPRRLQHHRHRADAAPARPAAAALGPARRRGGRCRGGGAHASRPGPARARVLGSGRDRAHRRRLAAAARSARRRRGRRSGRALNGMLARARRRAPARAPLPGRCQPRAAHAGDLAGGQRGVPGPPRRQPEVLADLQLDTARLQRLVGDLLTLERESAARRPSSGPLWTRSWRRGGRPRLHARQRITPGDRPRRARCAAPDARQPARQRRDPRSAWRRGQRPLTVCTVPPRAVRDEGPGPDPADLEHAFQRFWRAPRRRAGPARGWGSPSSGPRPSATAAA